MSTTLRRRRWAAAVAAGALTATLVGCTSDTGDTDLVESPDEAEQTSPTVEPSEDPTTEEPTAEEPTQEPTLSEQDQDIADARQAFIDYMQAYDAAAQIGFEPGDVTADAIVRTGGPAREAVVEDRDNYVAYNLTREGGTEVVTVEAVDYRDGDGSVDAFVNFKVCLDGSGVDTLINGQTQGIERGRSVQHVEMQQQEGNWLVWHFERDEGEDC